MNLVKDSALVIMVTSSLAGTPNKAQETRFLYDNIFSKDAFKPKASIFVDNANPRAMDYYEIVDVLKKSYSEINAPNYMPMSVQIARSYVESGNNPKAKSPVGARGLWQMMEPSWYDVMSAHFDNAYDPLLNGKASLRHINNVDIFLRQKYPGFDQLPIDHKRDLMNAAYNGGQGRLMSVGWDIDAMPKETRDYVKKMRDRTILEDMRIYDAYARQNNIVRMELLEYNR